MHFWGSNFKKIFFKKEILKIYFLRKQFYKNIWNVFFDRPILKIFFFWESNLGNVFFVIVNLKMYFLREQCWKCNFWGSNFIKMFEMYFLREQFYKNVWNVFFEAEILQKYLKWFFKGAILKTCFLRKQYWKCIFCESNFENVFVEEAILKMYFLRE